jgi:hypothetical protein
MHWPPNPAANASKFIQDVVKGKQQIACAGILNQSMQADPEYLK